MTKWDFEGQVVLITGGAGGLGIDLSHAYTEAGAKVYVCDWSETNIKQMRDTMSAVSHRGSYEAEVVDVRSVKELQDWVERVIQKEGKADILINAAGICPTASYSEVTEAIWDDVVDVNMKSAFFATQAIAASMKEHGYGRIVNVSSVGAHTGGAIATPPYAAAKAGMLAVTKSFANALSPFGICVNTVAPGPFDTVMIADFPKATMERIVASTPTRRVGQTGDVVQAILFMSDRSTSHITGATLDVNGGLYMR
ncbi:SDR family NAD(P)-dependent oxidoreductase [Paenibacillus mendelii]|uniref:SDR family NAD(P)-dependent oxidoreductase n=1 Tax=Paenibacillus mendelii TaxID=206163 RepID=A0ABV6JAJ7_9BACL|nr:SDR family NAD(P)-dependent oxidoreductase [Paenibacillus mendelii]MCQ6560696.1 SDR family oxidoreductase [Paenibacillus mendelii]